MSRILITDIKKGSIAEEAGIENGDFLLNINDTEIIDVLDYDFLIKDEYLTILIEKKDNSIEEIEIEKDFDEDIIETAIVYCDIAKQPNRKKCALLPWWGIEKAINKKDEVNEK